jgi:hypothetical protein
VAPKRIGFQNDKTEHDHREVITELENQRKNKTRTGTGEQETPASDVKNSHITNSNEGNSGETVTTQNPRPPHITPETNSITKGLNVKT